MFSVLIFVSHTFLGGLILLFLICIFFVILSFQLVLIICTLRAISKISRNKTCVISGGSDKDKASLKLKLKEIGAKITGSISGKTDAFVVAEDVGFTKEKEALLQKEKRPDTFRIFSLKGVAKRIGIDLGIGEII